MSEVNAVSGEKDPRLRALKYILLLAGVGFLLSLELLRVHLTVLKEPHHDFLCRVNEAMDCGAVAQSRQAVFLGVPVPVWGLLTYLLFFGLAGLSFVRKGLLAYVSDYALPLAAWCVLYSAYLAYVSAFVLKTFCAYCAGLYFVNLALFFASFPAARPLGEWWRRRGEEWRWLRGSPVMMGLAGVLVVVVIVGVIILYRWSHKPVTISLASGANLDLSADPYLGAFRAPITIIEFSDFECPACRKMYPVIDALLLKYPGQIKVIHKNYPLNSKCNPQVRTNMHLLACEAAAASECAFQMGKFEAYSKRLWETEDLSPPQLILMAREEGMDPKAFQTCLQSEDTKRALLADTEDGAKIPVEATPTFIINGYKFQGYHDVKFCSQIIERFLRGESPPQAELLIEP